MMTLSILDDFKQRLRRSRALRELAAQVQQGYLALAALGLASVILVIAQVELRLAYLDTLPPLTALDALRGLNVALTAALLGMLVVSHRRERALTRACLAPVGAVLRVQMAFELLTLLVGVVPPTIESSIPVWLTSAWNGDGAPPSWHLDQLGVLMLLRVPLVMRWLIGAFRPEVASPTYVAWQYNVDVTYAFAAKFLFTKHPLTVVLATVTTSWVCGAIGVHCAMPSPCSGPCILASLPLHPPTPIAIPPPAALHSLEYAQEPRLLAWAFTTFDVISGSGSASPFSVLGRCCTLGLSVVGILAIAVVTATLCSDTELDPSEAWLISCIERRAARYATSSRAVRLVQRQYRLHRANNTMRHAPSLLHRTVAAAARKAVATEARQFKKARLGYELGSNTGDVANMKTLNEYVRGMQTSLIHVTTAVDELRRALRHDGSCEGHVAPFSVVRTSSSPAAVEQKGEGAGLVGVSKV
jgi:hypothetical protein